MLNVSITLSMPDWGKVQQMAEKLLQSEEIKNIYLIDNSGVETDFAVIKSLFSSKKIHYLWEHDLGWGASHNIALRESVWQRTRYHLVMDTDIDAKAEDIDKLHYFMDKNPQVGLVMPRIVDGDGREVYESKLLPTPLEIFLPVFISKKRQNRNELRQTGYKEIMNVPNLSGKFMFLRTDAALKARLLDERYTKYAGPTDLTRTIHRQYLTLYVPDITVADKSGGDSAKKKRTEYAINMTRYFNKWGLVFDSERKEMNRLTLQLCGEKR